MRKHIFTLMLALLSVAMMAQKPAMLRLSSPSQTEQTALDWFAKNIDGNVIGLDDLSDLSASKYSCLWIMVDRVGINVGAENLPDNLDTLAKDYIKKYVEEGGNLLLTNHATQIAYSIGRTAYAPKLFGSGEGGDNQDEWGIQAVIGRINDDITSDAYNRGAYDNRGHAIYKGLEGNENYGHETYALIGAGKKLDHNCMWDLNLGDYALADNPNKVEDFENKNNATVLGTWQHVIDYCCAGIVEFDPNEQFSGKVLACGLAAYDWTQWEYSPNFVKFTTNMINYLSSNTTTGIELPKPLPAEADATYNIAGQRVKANAKGLIVSKGKKTFKK